MAMCTSCGDYYTDRRLDLGYRTCLECGDAEARTMTWCTAPLNKSNYILISDPEDLKGLNPKWSAM
jgi:hypothetical protein